MEKANGDWKKRRFFDWEYVRIERRAGNRRAAAFVILAIPLFFLLEHYVIGAGRVTDISMYPTISHGRYFFINKYAYRLGLPGRGDIVVFHPTENERWYYVKRVVGLPGETLSISQGRVHVNGQPLAEPYARGPTEPEMGPMQLKEGTFFVLGDNRSHSEDSRSFGPVRLGKIVGKISAKGGWPLR